MAVGASLGAAADFLSLQNVTKVFMDGQNRAVVAVDEINLSAKAGEFVSIVGPSGCGKSTVLRLVAGLERPTSGTITVQGNAVVGPGRERGLVFQSYGAFPWLTIRENVAFAIKNAVSSTDIVDRWLKDMGLTEFAGSYPKILSGGMLQRLALARTMIVEPKILLLDEPFGALDERTRESMQELLLQITSRNRCTVLFVTHDIRESVLLSDRVVVLSSRPGRVRAIINSTVTKPRSRKLYGTSAFELLVASVADQWEPEQPANR